MNYSWMLLKSQTGNSSIKSARHRHSFMKRAQSCEGLPYGPHQKHRDPEPYFLLVYTGLDTLTLMKLQFTWAQGLPSFLWEVLLLFLYWPTYSSLSWLEYGYKHRLIISPIQLFRGFLSLLIYNMDISWRRLDILCFTWYSRGFRCLNNDKKRDLKVLLIW